MWIKSVAAVTCRFEFSLAIEINGCEKSVCGYEMPSHHGRAEHFSDSNRQRR